MNIVFICIGTPKIKGDSIGPRIGDMLKEKQVKAFVYGSSSHPITSLNVDKYFSIIKNKHKKDLVIAIDAALGSNSDIGKIKIKENGIRPGGAFNKTNYTIGDIGILAIVGNSNKDRFLELKNAEDYVLNNLIDSLLILLENLCSENLLNMII